MAGLLDFLDNPNILSQILGVGGSVGEGSAMPGNTAPPMPPPMNGGIGSDAGQAPGAPQPAGMMPMPMPRPPQAPPPPGGPQSSDSVPDYGTSGSMPGVAKPDYVGPDANAIPGALGSDPANAPMPPPAPQMAMNATRGTDAYPQPRAAGVMPMPPPAPNANFAQRFDASNPGMPVRSPPTTDEGGMIAGAPGMGANARGPGGPPPGPPLNILPPGATGGAPLPPPSALANPPATQTTGGGLAAAFGLDPARIAAAQKGDALRAGLNGLGKGLSAVGRTPLGASKGQAFAAGAGGALEGGTDMQEKQKATNFNQLSSAFKDVLAGKNAEGTAGYRDAQMKYLEARAKSIEAMTKAGKISGAYQNSPEYKVLRIEQQAANEYKEELKGLREQFKGDAEGFAKAKSELRIEYDNRRKELYKLTGIDPNHAEKLQTMGLTRDNPFDAGAMTPEEFEARVPKGAIYRNSDGQLYRRDTQPAAGHHGVMPPAEAPASTAADDREATTEAA